MTALVEGVRRRLGRRDDIVDRIDGLEEAVRAARGRLPDDLVEEAAGVAQRAGDRLRLSGDHTVVALAGATGSGKSSTFNALSGLDLAATGVRRPTTSWTTACVWGAEGAEELLDWLGVPPRHQVRRDSLLDEPGRTGSLDGLVLLDLPDHDSTEVAHHVEVDRLVRLADLMVWVLDPQKYADAAVHERYLRPLAGHGDVVLVALNHIDEVRPSRREAMLADLRRLLSEDGLSQVRVIATSAVSGEGIPDLTRAIAREVKEKKAVSARLMADVAVVAGRLAEANGDHAAGRVAPARREELVDAFADAAGVPTVVRAVEQSTRQRAGRATGWPVTSWLSRLKPDPLRRLHLDLGVHGRGSEATGTELTAAPRASLPAPSQVQRARVGTAVRALSDDVVGDLSPAWSGAVRRASLSRLDDLDDALDQAVTSVDLGVSRTPLWWRGTRVVQWVLVLAAAVGALWLVGLALLGYLQLDGLASPEVQGLPVPTLLLLGGVAAGVVLAALARVLVRFSARRRARTAERRLRAAVAEVADRLVVEPVQAEVEAHEACRAALATALRR